MPLCRLCRISIHAPTRGATGMGLYIWSRTKDFNPRSYKRSDDIFNIYHPFSVNFNPRSYKRSDYGACFKFGKPYISIHAPTRGATSIKKSFHLIPVFQSTLLQEERPQDCTSYLSSILFQSTLLQEERHTEMVRAILDGRFQSTLLQEERQHFK